ncbi:unnamed protein product, partial [Meganyctiphanes norvegica]
AFCKEFPLRIGKDEIWWYFLPDSMKVGSESHDQLIRELTRRSHRMQLMKNIHNRKTIGMNQVSRHCRYPGCTVTAINLLFCCKCLEVCYCSKGHQEDDTEHRQICNKTYIMMNSYTRNNSTLSIPYMKAYPATNEYRPLRGGKTQIAENIISEITEAVVTEDIVDKWTKTQVEILSDRLAMPFTILYCLQKLGVGQLCTPLAKVTTLNIHLMTALPLFDLQMWELLLHRLPELKNLNITYVGCAGLNWHPNNVHNTMLKLERCKDCEKKDRIVSIKVLLSHYHMYFSSEDYIEPDVVAIFGYNKKLLDSKSVDKEDVNELTSLRNMTYNKDTLLIVTDHEDLWLKLATSEINNARPIDILLPIFINPLKAEGHIENMKKHGKRFNILRYLTCVQKK